MLVRGGGTGTGTGTGTQEPVEYIRIRKIKDPCACIFEANAKYGDFDKDKPNMNNS